jgi:hypothetical protein
VAPTWPFARAGLLPACHSWPFMLAIPHWIAWPQLRASRLYAPQIHPVRSHSMPTIHTARTEAVDGLRRRLALTLIGAAGLGAALPSHAGLIEWLHGAPPPRPKAPPPAQVARVSHADGLAPDPQVEGFLRALASAVMARDGKPMLPRLADRYTIDDLPSGFKAADLFVQAVEQIPGADEIIVRSITVQGGVRIAQTEFRYPKAVVKSYGFRFNAEGQLLASDLFKLQRRDHGA